MTDRNTNGYVAIPNWFLWALSSGLTMVLAAVGLAIPWAGNVGAELSAVKAKVEAASEVRTLDRMELNRRLDRMEARFDTRFEKIEQSFFRD